MAAIDVVTKYKALNDVLCSHGKSNRQHYDVAYHEEVYKRKTSEMMEKQNKATEEFLMKNQEIILISVENMIELTVKYEALGSNRHYLHGNISILSGEYEGLDEMGCNNYFAEMVVSLMESACSIEEFAIAYSEIGFCPLNQTRLMGLKFYANF